MIHFFFGEDIYGARHAIDELAATLKARLQFLEKNELEEKSLLSRLQAGGGLFGQVLFVVRDPSWLPASIQKDITDAREKSTAADCVLWERGAIDQRSVFFKTFKKEAHHFPYLSEEALLAWLGLKAKEYGSVIEPLAARIMIERLGMDRYQLEGELKKLTLMFSAIGAEQVKQAVPVGVALHDDAFALTDALMRGQEKVVMNIIEKLLASGESELRLLALIAYQIRLLLLIKTGLKEKLSSEEMASRFKVHPYPIKKNTPLAARYGNAQLLDMYVRIMATDFAIKQGKVDAKTGFIMLMQALSGAVRVGVKK